MLEERKETPLPNEVLFLFLSELMPVENRETPRLRSMEFPGSHFLKLGSSEILRSRKFSREC